MAGFQVTKEVQKMILYGVIILIVAVVIIAGGAFYFVQDYETEELENSLDVSRLLFSEDCLASENNFGKLNMLNFDSDVITKCTGVDDNSKLGLHLRLLDLDENLINEVEINKPLTSQCMLNNLKNIRERYFCSFSKHYVLFEDKKGVLEIEVVNDLKK